MIGQCGLKIESLKRWIMSRAEACRYLFEIIRYSLAGGEAPTIHEGVDWEKLYRIVNFTRLRRLWLME